MKITRRNFGKWIFRNGLVVPFVSEIIRPSFGVIIHGPRPTAAAGGSSIAIDASSPIRFTGTPANNVDVTSASFTPPNNSVLVICISADNVSATDTLTITSSATVGTTPVARKEKQGTNGGYAGIFTSVVTTGSAMTVSVRRTAGGTNSTKRISVKVYVVTGANTTTPFGASQSGTSTTNNLTSTTYTSTVNNSRGFGAGTDWQASGAGTTNPTSTDTSDGATYSGQLDALSCYKSADTATSGSSVSMNFDAAGSSAAVWQWVTLEIVP